MAKDLPYFKFFSAEWIQGNITLCSMAAQGLFINVAAFYWSRMGNMSLTHVQQRFNMCSTELEELLNSEMLKVDNEGNISIEFLDEQLSEFSTLREKRSKAGQKSGEARRKKDVNTCSTHVEQNRTIKEKEKEKENIHSDFEIFWKSYHDITGRAKEDKAAAIKHWKRLSKNDRAHAVNNIQPYFQSISDPQYCKKARTYLADQSFNNEFRMNGSASAGPTPPYHKPLQHHDHR